MQAGETDRGETTKGAILQPKAFFNFPCHIRALNRAADLGIRGSYGTISMALSHPYAVIWLLIGTFHQS